MREEKEEQIRRTSLAFLLSLLLHLIVVAAIAWLLYEKSVRPKAINRQRITLDLNQIQTLPPKPSTARPTPPKPRPKPPVPPAPRPTLPTPKPIQKVEAKKTSPSKKEKAESVSRGPTLERKVNREQNRTKVASEKESNLVVNMHITPKKRKQAKIKVKTTPKKPPKKATQKPKKIAKKTVQKKRAVQRKRSPSKAQRTRPAPRRHKPQGPDSRLISSLYGSSYSRMSSVQRRFIDENLRRILQISQRTLNYLGYPREAARFGEQGTNVVEFWLHPNGDISGLRLRRRLRSSALNRQTIEVIKTAYMHYPRPRVKTKIIIYVRYRLY
ncbi:TonB family protein [Nitratifractor sp.]